MDIIDLIQVVQTSNELYPESITKKPMVNAKNLFKRLSSAFTENELFEASYEELHSFCGSVPARIEFIHSIFETYDKGDTKFRNSLKAGVPAKYQKPFRQV